MREKPIEVINYKGYDINIYPDNNGGEDPREWDNLGVSGKKSFNMMKAIVGKNVIRL